MSIITYNISNRRNCFARAPLWDGPPNLKTQWCSSSEFFQLNQTTAKEPAASNLQIDITFEYCTIVLYWTCGSRPPADIDSLLRSSAKVGDGFRQRKLFRSKFQMTNCVSRRDQQTPSVRTSVRPQPARLPKYVLYFFFASDNFELKPRFCVCPTTSAPAKISSAEFLQNVPASFVV